MNHDEFAFFNQQLAAMLRAGIPLEGALKQLCAGMKTGTLRAEMRALEADLATGIPLKEALARRRLPEFYARMIEIGACGNDLPGVLTLLADHYQRLHNLGARLKRLMVYPMTVLIAAFLLSCFLGYLLGTLVWPNLESIAARAAPPAVKVALWLTPVLLGGAVGAALIVLAAPIARRALRWRVPAFKESSLAQVASAMSLMLRSGVPLDQALALVERLEQGTRAGSELALWRQRLASGQGKFSDLAPPGRAFPAMFIWLVGRCGDDLAGGFQRAAEIYQARARYQAELFLYSALPCSVLALGVMIITQMQPVFHTLVQFMNMIGDNGGGKD